MMLTECIATRVGGEGEPVPFTIIDNGFVIRFFFISGTLSRNKQKIKKLRHFF